MKEQKRQTKRRQSKIFRVRKNVFGISAKPRMAVYRSHKNMNCQLIDDAAGKTLVSCSTMDPDLRASLKGLTKTQRAKKLGEEIANRAKNQGIHSAVFDRRWYKFHGRIRALAEAAIQGGLKI